MNTINNYRTQQSPSFGATKFKGDWNDKIKDAVMKTDLFQKCEAEEGLVNILFSQSINPANYLKTVKFVKEHSGFLGLGKVIAKAEGKGTTTESAQKSLLGWLAGM